MIRKMLVIAAAVAMPAATMAGVTAVQASSVASATTPIVAPVTCTLGGKVTFAGKLGISQHGTVSTATTSTSKTTLTATGDPKCQALPVVTAIKQPTTTCASTSLVPLPPSAGAFAGLAPGYVQFPGCVTTPADTQYGSAWAFLGGVDVNGVPSSTTGGIKTALAKGVKFTDNGVLLTLLVGNVVALSPADPTPVCGGNAGFGLSGTVKLNVSHTWSLNLCLGGDTGVSTTNSFLGDLVTEVLHTNSNTADTIAITSALVTSPSAIVIN